jgi:Flp pilus assembly protein protease CpaA
MYLEIIILGLIIGSYYDVKTRHVSNQIVGSIFVVSLILLILNGLRHDGFEIMYIMTILGYLAAYKYHGLGGADLKALIPITFILSPVQLYLFLIIAVSAHTFIYMKIDKKVPFFVGITFAFALVHLINVV